MKKSYLIAISMSIIILVWMASGMFASDPKVQATKPKDFDKKQISVKAQLQEARLVPLYISAQSAVEPARHVTLRSEVSGKVTEILVDQGQFIEANSVLIKLAMEDRQERLSKEKALLKSRQQSYIRAKALAKENFQSKSIIEETLAAVKSSESSLAQITLEIENTRIKAPFDGIFENKAVEVGSYVAMNGEVAGFVDKSAIHVIAAVSQQNIKNITLNTPVEVQFATGENRQGRVIYIAPVANDKTRTFRVEIKVENSDNALFAGTTAVAKLPIGQEQAHLISPGILSINDEGEIGLKLVVENNRVKFFPVKIIQSKGSEVWVSGLPKSAKIITVGQGFVTEGLEVVVSLETIGMNYSNLDSNLPSKAGVSQ